LAAKRGQALRREHLRFHGQRARGGFLHCFVLDCSGSMLASLALIKGLLRQLIQRAYQQRAQIAIIGFAGLGANLHLDVSSARPLTSRALDDWLQRLQAGGGTPLDAGTREAAAVLGRAARANPAQQRWLWLFTDGRCDDLPTPPDAADVRIVVDCERQRVALGRCLALARQWRADYCTPEDLLDETSA